MANIGQSSSELRRCITIGNYYSNLFVDGTVRAETTKDVVNDMLTYKAAALTKVRQSIMIRSKDEAERKRLFTLLRNEEWIKDNFLHRQVRKHFRHGKSCVKNQFVVRSDRHYSEVVDGKLIVIIRIAKKYGDDIRLTTTSSGKDVDLGGSNLRIIVKDGFSEIHYAAQKNDGRVCGDRTVGIDKGYSEAFVDSDGQEHGQTFGSVMTHYNDKIFKTNKQRNKLHAIEKKYREKGCLVKADRIKRNNLGRKKIDRRKYTAQAQLRGIAFQSAHTLVDKAGVIASEDLSSPIVTKKSQWKKFNRKMSFWAKGILAKAIDSVCTQRKARHVLVNAAYTSQMDSTNGLLQGKRVGDRFYRENGDVLQADHNAARNVLARLYDSEISRFTPFKEVRQILLTRSPAQLSVNRLELGGESRQPSADKSQIALGSFL